MLLLIYFERFARDGFTEKSLKFYLFFSLETY